MKTKSIFGIVLLITLLISCKHTEKEKIKKKVEEAEKEYVIDLNKDFMYQCTITSFKTKIPIEDVKKILKEYYIYKKNCSFKGNSFIILDDYDFKKEAKHTYDLINEATDKFSIPYENVIAIYSELETSQRINELEDEILSLSSTVEDLENEINRK